MMRDASARRFEPGGADGNAGFSLTAFDLSGANNDRVRADPRRSPATAI